MKHLHEKVTASMLFFIAGILITLLFS